MSAATFTGKGKRLVAGRVSVRPHLVQLLLASFFLLTGADASALTITTGVRALPGPPTTVIRLTGMFEKGDAVEVRKTLVRLRAARETPAEVSLATVELSSQGGDVFEGVKIGYLFREFGVATLVRKSDLCLSACAFAFLGGTMAAAPVEPAPSRTIEAGGQVGFHNVALNYGSLRNSIADDRVATTEGFNLALGGSSMIIRYATDMGIDPRFISRMLGRPADQFDYVDTVREFLNLQICLSDATLPVITIEQQAANICNNATRSTTPAPAPEGPAMNASEARVLLLRQLEASIAASRASERLASNLRATIESRNDALTSEIYAGFKAAGLALPDLSGVVYELRGFSNNTPASCLASLSPFDLDRYDVALRGPKGMSPARYSAPQGCRWLFRYDVNEIVNPKRSAY